MKYIILLICVTFCFASYSQTGETEAYDYLDEKTEKLEAVYIKAMSLLSDSLDILALSESQTNWKKFMKSNCNFKSQQESQGGVISNKMYLGCQVKMTEERILELEDFIKNGF